MLGFILGPMLEENLRRAMMFSRGDPTTLVTRPLSASFVALAAIVLIVILIPSAHHGRDEVFVEED